MARGDSPLYNFLMDALMDRKYHNLYWIDTNQGIFCLKCLCKSKRGWTPSDSKIFDDYHKLKPRKSNDKRQRFLVAMKACPIIEPLEKISTKEEKFYKFKARGTSSVNASGEIAAPSTSNENMDVEAIPVISTTENGPPTGDTSMEDNVCVSQTGNDLDSFLSPMLADGNNSLPEDPGDFEFNVETPTDIDELLQRMDVSVPDVTENDLESPEIGASTSLYNDSTDSMRSCSQALDSSDPWNLQGEELSYHFEVKAEDDDVPPDYDPVKDFLESVGTPKPAETTAVDPETIQKADPDQLGSVPTMPGTSGESSKSPSVKVFKLNDNDGIARSLRGDNSEKKYYMMVLSPESM